TRRSIEAAAGGKSNVDDGPMEQDEPVRKRIDYDTMDDESSQETTHAASQNSDSGRAFMHHPKPKKIDFTVCSSQRSEPDIEPTDMHTPARFGLPPTSQSAFGDRLATPSYSQMHSYSQDDMDFLTPRDQPVIPLSNPTTPSPLKKRQRLSSDADLIRAEEVQNLTQDMTHMEVRQARRGPPSFSSQSPMNTDSPRKTEASHKSVVINSKRSVRPTSNKATSFLSDESYVNPFAPEPATESGRKKRSRRKRRSFPSAWVGGQSASPVSRYLSEFSEQEVRRHRLNSLLDSCLKKFDGWVYAVKKSKRHFRGKADTCALAALSSSNHVVRYFDAWIEDDLLYIQLEHLRGCSLAHFVDKSAPHKIPEATLCRVLCHIAQFDCDVGGNDRSPPAMLTVLMLKRSELLEGNRNNLRAGDIFALGATIYELALGAMLPSNGEEWQKIRDGDLVMFRQYSNSLQHLIASMMHPDALQRPLAEDILQHEVVVPFR
ncbi:hypothetical protein BBJ28_00011772, partial [Nothophytophthora sp. Chile5]